ncbi:MAG: hypothetical protein M1269_00470 [Chloroflexi bacterium]|nr:hypothetical protein [Chloroflexota bacterium]
MKIDKNDIILLVLVLILLVLAYQTFVKNPGALPVPPGSSAQGAGQNLSGGFGEMQAPPQAPAYSAGNSGGMGGRGVPPPGGGSDEYRDFLIGVILLEKTNDKELSLTSEQAKKLLTLIQEDEEMKEAIPNAQKGIPEILTDEQMKYIEKWASRQKDTQAPTPAEISQLVDRTLKSIKGGAEPLR